MKSITIRRLDDATKARLRARAARHSRSMEAEAREILRCGLSRTAEGSENLAEAMRAFFAPLGGVDLPEIPREPMREPPAFGK